MNFTGSNQIYVPTIINYKYMWKVRLNFLSTMKPPVAEWLSSWLVEQEVRDSIPGLATWISEIGYLLLPSRDMAEIPLKRRKFSMQPTNQWWSRQQHLGYDISHLCTSKLKNLNLYSVGL